MFCKRCGSEVVKGRSRLLKRKVRLCTVCGRVDYLDYRTGTLRVLWYGQKEYREKVG